MQHLKPKFSSVLLVFRLKNERSYLLDGSPKSESANFLKSTDFGQNPWISAQKPQNSLSPKIWRKSVDFGKFRLKTSKIILILE